MKKGMLMLLLLGALFAQGQSLKEALYSGKLKNDPGTVIRKGDTLATKMKDSIAKNAAPADTVVVTAAPVITDTFVIKSPVPVDAPVVVATDNKEEAPAAASAPPAAPLKDNNALWKDYMATVISSVNTEVLPAKKIKKGTYYAMVSYSIGTDGEVTVGEVTLTPENATLQQGIKARLMDAPRLSPVLSSSGAPRKVTKKHSFTLTKE